jgi:hypothetical protein
MSGIKDASGFTQAAFYAQVSTIGAPTTSSTTFADIGDNGSTAGWPVVTIPKVDITQRFLVEWDTHSFYQSVLGPSVDFQIVINGVAPTQNSYVNGFGVINQSKYINGRSVLLIAAGLNISVKLQWKVNTIGTMNASAGNWLGWWFTPIDF